MRVASSCSSVMAPTSHSSLVRILTWLDHAQSTRQASDSPTLTVRCSNNGDQQHETHRAAAVTGLVADPANGIYIRWIGAGNYLAVCRSGGVERHSIPHRAKRDHAPFKFTITTTSVIVSVDGVNKGTITTTSPPWPWPLALAQHEVASDCHYHRPLRRGLHAMRMLTRALIVAIALVSTVSADEQQCWTQVEPIWSCVGPRPDYGRTVSPCRRGRHRLRASSAPPSKCSAAP